MVQKCSLINVTEVFFKEPTKVHFIKEISRKINLAPTSIRNHIKYLKKEGMIIEKESSPFNGLVANLDNDKFIFYKRSFNLFSLFKLRETLINSIAPSGIILFGSYSRGEDVENSDVDLIVLRKTKKEINLEKFEKELGRKIHITYLNNINELDIHVKENAKRGVIIYGGY